MFMTRLRSIPGFSNYVVSDNGKVFNRDRGTEVKPFINKSNGYKHVKLYKNGVRYDKSIHQLVMGDQSTPEHEVDHINRNKLDNRSSNLRYVPHSFNVLRNYHKDL